MKPPSSRSVGIFFSGFATCGVLVIAASFGFYFFFVKPQIASLQGRMRLKPPPIPVQAPADLSLHLLSPSGEEIEVKKLQGKVLILNSWATWCGPCRAELSSLARLAEKYHGAKDVAVLCISEEQVNEIKKCSEMEGTKPPIYSLKEKGLPHMYKKGAIPATFIIDKSGQIVFEHVGSAQWDSTQVVDFIEQLRKKS